MFPKVWFMNLIMAGVIVFFGARTYRVWSQTDKAAVEIMETQKAARQAEISVAKRVTLPESAYETIARNNLLNPNRAEVKPEKPDKGAEVKKPTVSVKPLFLHGVVITGEYKTALVGKLEPKPGEKSTQWVRVGDMVGHFRVVEINNESIIVAEGADHYEILLYDKGRPKKSTALSKKEMRPTVVSPGVPKKSGFDFSAGKADDSKTGSEEDSETKYQHVKQPSEELRRKILSTYRDSPAPPPPELAGPTGHDDWDIPMQKDQTTPSRAPALKPAP